VKKAEKYVVEVVLIFPIRKEGKQNKKKPSSGF